MTPTHTRLCQYHRCFQTHPDWIIVYCFAFFFVQEAFSPILSKNTCTTTTETIIELNFSSFDIYTWIVLNKRFGLWHGELINKKWHDYSLVWLLSMLSSLPGWTSPFHFVPLLKDRATALEHVITFSTLKQQTWLWKNDSGVYYQAAGVEVRVCSVELLPVLQNVSTYAETFAWLFLSYTMENKPTYQAHWLLKQWNL